MVSVFIANPIHHGLRFHAPRFPKRKGGKEGPPLTRELAIKYRDMPGSPTERRLSDKRLSGLTEKAVAGRLLTVHWADAELDGVNEAEATKFWHEVARLDADDINGREEEPAVVLELWLIAAKERRHPLNAAQFYQGAIYAWNAYRQEKSIKKINATITKGKEPREPLE
jgi:hypothetical protein